VTDDPILAIGPLGRRWQTLDPFLFCVHHHDQYPAGNTLLAPDPALLTGRQLGMDFEGHDGWSMYHGDVVPGFPRHPHRGFETVTLARSGFIDHSDSLGATARFGQGDVQWMTAGAGICHCEMFPLVNQDAPNPTELFQIWLNLPAEDKLVEPHFTMFWAPTLRRHLLADSDGRAIEVVCVAGSLDGEPAPSPPPNSWASRAASELAIWTIKMQAGARWSLPTGPSDVHRVLYFFAGETLSINGQPVAGSRAVQLRADADVVIENTGSAADMLLLQGRPIGEPVVQHGPFVMNSSDEIEQTIAQYQRTEFGGWPWASDDPVHPRTKGRFARHADGREETPA
jgi:redox-sensitive bicupin YhaK (pirin superfamily)